MIILTAQLRADLEDAITESLNAAKARGYGSSIAARLADLADLNRLEDGDALTGDLLDTAMYFGLV